MILRVLRGRGSRDNVISLKAALDAELGAAGERRGPERFHIGWRPGPGPDHDVVVVSHWMSAEAASAADADQRSPLVIARRHIPGVQVAHFEVDDTIRRHSDQQAVAIRIATGRFSRPGADSEMQELLRQRAPLIGDEMAEAWVGRRLTGREVEVTFVSAWRRLPADLDLEAPFWPDIALRYDEFVVEVYSAVGVE